ncbi:MAG: hypothetical protein WCJ30_00725 [Deltaproteobacteria bacterium]
MKRENRIGRALAAVFVAVLACGAAAPVIAHAQGTPPALAPGAARGTGEAPGGAPLAGEPAAADPSAERGMTFAAGGGPQCRDTVPGGTLLAVAYAITIALMGGYVTFLAWKNVQLARAVDALEGQIAKRSGAKMSDKDAE